MATKISNLYSMQEKQLFRCVQDKIQAKNFSEMAEILGFNKSQITRWWDKGISTFGKAFLILIYFMDDSQVLKFKEKLIDRKKAMFEKFMVDNYMDFFASSGTDSRQVICQHHQRYYDAIECLDKTDILEIKKYYGVLTCIQK